MAAAAFRRLPFAVVLATSVLCLPAPAAAQGGAGASAAYPDESLYSIVGRVSDAAGQPVADVFVTALRPDAERSYVPVSVRLFAVTDRDGMFRLADMPRGDFFVVALPHNAVRARDGTPNREGFANTFFPSARAVDRAQTVSVAPRTPATANITLQPARLAYVSGMATGADGQPLGGSVLRVTHGDGLFGLDSRSLGLRGDGAFVLPALQPGTYYLVVHGSPWPPPRGVMPHVSQAMVVVDGRDVANVHVKHIQPVHVTGRFVVSAADRAALVLSDLNVSGYPQSFEGNPGPRPPAIIRDDLTFEFVSWPVMSRFRVTVPRSFYVKAIRLNGRIVTDEFIEFVEGQRITGVEIELGRR